MTNLKKSPICLGIIVTIAVVWGCSRDPNELVESAKQYISAGKYNEAVIELRNAIKLNPQLAEAHYQLGLAYLRGGAATDARQEFNRTVLIQTGNAEAQILYANLLMLD